MIKHNYLIKQVPVPNTIPVDTAIYTPCIEIPPPLSLTFIFESTILKLNDDKVKTILTCIVTVIGRLSYSSQKCYRYVQYRIQ